MARLFFIAASILILAWPSDLVAQSTSDDAQSDSTVVADQRAELDRLFALLAEADQSNWKALEDEIWDQWSRSGSDTFDLLLERGRTAMEGGDLETAIEHLTALTDHAPDFAEGWNARATAFFLSGQMGLSLDDIARVLTLEPRHFGALSGLGIILEDLGDPERALEAYRHALAIHPQSPRVKEAVERLESANGQDI